MAKSRSLMVLNGFSRSRGSANGQRRFLLMVNRIIPATQYAQGNSFTCILAAAAFLPSPHHGQQEESDRPDIGRKAASRKEIDGRVTITVSPVRR
ncbi:hypothetical protein ACSF6V_10080 [Escherichia coli]|uniref:hypothetical protein n=1 Tax=Escherichia coli TaxID=562 RepID=UPI003EE9AAFD